MVDVFISDEAPWLKIDFSRVGNSVEFVNEGWNGPESHFSWTLGETSVLTIDRAPERGELLARLEVWPFVAPPALTRQRLDVSVNGVRVAQFEVAGREVFEFRIPESAFRSEGSLRFQFDHPDAARPIDLTETNDSRVLGVAFVGLSLRAGSEVAQTELTPLDGMATASRSAPSAGSSGVATTATTEPAAPRKLPVQDSGEGLVAKFASLFRSRNR